MKIVQVLKKAYKYMSDADYRFIVNIHCGFYRRMEDAAFVTRKYKAVTKKELDLKHPMTYNEKLQWLKVYDRRPEYVQMVDKVAAKAYVAGIIGEQYIIPTLGVWASAADIDFDALPDQFVLKCNHNSGLGMCICTDKSKLDWKRVKKELSKGLKEDYYQITREWPYKDVPRRILAEPYMVDESGTELKDYKVFCFDGVPKLVQVDLNRFVAHKRNLYSTDWQLLDVTSYYPPEREQSIPRPQNLEKMLAFAAKLSQGVAHMRVDFYSIGQQLYFGELTFFNSSGYKPFDPPEWNRIIGDWIQLPAAQDL